MILVEGYRSVRKLWTRVDGLNLVLGPNGSGKTNLHRALRLVENAVSGTLARAVADEGGMPSIAWAGERKANDPVRVYVQARFHDYTYAIELGLVAHPGDTVFRRDPEVKSERIELSEERRKPVVMLERKGPSAWLRDTAGKRTAYPLELSPSESVLGQLRDRHRWPEVSAVVDRMRGWRFYEHFRTDPESPIRRAQVGVRTHCLAEDGHDLASVLQTIREIGDSEALDAAIADAFPGARLVIAADEAVRLSLGLRMPSIHRALEAREMSDGTLRFLCLAAALLGPRPPELLAINEPETSLHGRLLPALARLVVRAARDSQMLVTTHSRALAHQIAALAPDTRTIELQLHYGETRITDQRLVDDDKPDEDWEE